jgi:hypothetical protein
VSGMYYEKHICICRNFEVCDFCRHFFWKGSVVAAVIEDQRDTNAYVAPELSMENAKEAIAAWPHKDQETLYRWLHTLKCRM